jgi:hypothetical protein
MDEEIEELSGGLLGMASIDAIIYSTSNYYHTIRAVKK